MADLSPDDASDGIGEDEPDDLLSILNRETQEAIKRIAEQLQLSDKPRTGLERNSKYRLVCQAYEARRERTELFDADLFADPAWDILLAMYRDHLAGRPQTVSSAVWAADTPFTTGLRWLRVLENRGLVSRIDNPNDARSALVELTPLAINKMETYLERLRTKSSMRAI
jgi:hypothetical protein